MPLSPDRPRWSDEQLTEFHEEFLHHAEKEQEFQQVLLEAFPQGDLPAHRQYHEKLIEAAEEQKRFYSELRIGLAKNTVWAATMVLVGLLLLGGITKLKQILGITP